MEGVKGVDKVWEGWRKVKGKERRPSETRTLAESDSESERSKENGRR